MKKVSFDFQVKGVEEGKKVAGDLLDWWNRRSDTGSDDVLEVDIIEEYNK